MLGIQNKSLSRVKAIDLNYTNAANEAFNSAADNLIENILPEILEGIT